MFKFRSNNKTKNLAEISDIQALGETQEGVYFPTQIIKNNNLCWIRVSANLLKEIPAGTTVTISLPVQPFIAVPARRYSIGNTSGFMVGITADGKLTVTPYGEAMPAGRGINFSEVFFLKQ